MLKPQRPLVEDVVQQRCWTFLACLRDPRLAIRQHHSPLSDDCKGLGFAFTKPSICCIGCCREGRVGRGAEAACMPTAFCRLNEIFRKPWNGVIFTAANSLAPGSTELADSTEPIVPASPNRPAVPDARCPLHLKFHSQQRFYRWREQRTEIAQL